MANPTYEVTKVYWLPTIANKAAPTAAELAAGTELTEWIPVDGVNRSPSQNMASQAMLGSSFVEEGVGTWGIGLTLTFVRHELAADDDAWELFDYKTAGFLLIAPFGTPATGKRVEVFPAEAHKPVMQATAENAKQKFQVAFAVTDEPAFDAIMAA